MIEKAVGFVAENRIAIGFSILLYLGFVCLVLGAMANAAEYPEEGVSENKSKEGVQ